MRSSSMEPATMRRSRQDSSVFEAAMEEPTTESTTESPGQDLIVDNNALQNPAASAGCNSDKDQQQNAVPSVWSAPPAMWTGTEDQKQEDCPPRVMSAPPTPPPLP